MATTLFPTATVAPQTSYASATTRLLSFSRGSAATSQADASVASLVTAANPQGTGLVAPWKLAAGITLQGVGALETSATISTSLFWVTPPLRGVAITNAVTANIRGFESATAANYGVGCKLYRIVGGVVSNSFAQGSNTTELGTSEGASSISMSINTGLITINEGNQIGALIYFCSAGGTSASGRTGTGVYSGPTSAASGDTFFTFVETIVPRGNRQPAVNFNDPAFF